MSTNKRHKPEDIVRALRRADELSAQNLTQEQVAGELGISPATLYNWRRKYADMSVAEAKRLKALEKENSSLKRLLGDYALQIQGLKELLSGKF